MTRTATQLTNLTACADTVSSYFAGIRHDLESLRDHVVATRAGHGLLTAEAISSAVLAPTRTMMARHPILGGGFVAAPGFLSDVHLYLAWWQGDDRQLLAQAAGPWEEAPVDYTRQEWFRVPAGTGEAHVAGPYVDYVCSDEYLLTATMPVTVDGRLAGVVGADTLLEVFESLLMPTVRAAGAIVINHHDRVVVSADPRRPAGRLVDRTQFADIATCAGTPFSVVA